MILDEYRVAPMKTGGGWKWTLTSPGRGPEMTSGYATEAEARRAAATHYADRMVAEAIVHKRDPAYGPLKGHDHYFEEALARFRA